jgi:hypothetical protein
MEEFSQLASDGTIEITPAEPQDAPSLFEPEAQSDRDGVAEEAAPETVNVAPRDAESPEVESAGAENLEGTSLPEPQDIAELQPSGAAEAADSQPQSDAESSNVPEAEHPIGK